MLALVLVHGVFWSGLLSAPAYLTSLLPERRRAGGIGYWGLSSAAAIVVAPSIAFWILQNGGWRWICASCGALNSFGYGAVTTFSAVYADALGIAPRSIYLTALAS